ncbi:MAG: B12-binding domain-containing radical SAM protein [Anaerolineae bacterium]
MRILLLYPENPDTFWSFRYALPFIRKKANLPPLGLLTVAALLPESWEKRLVDMNVEPLQQKDIDWADYIFISAMVVQRDSTHAAIKRCKEAGKKIVAGGPLFLAEYEDFPEVDYFVLNEGELTLPPFIRDLEAGNPQRMYTTTEFADLTKTPVPLWHLAKLKYYSDMCLQYSRGCPFACDFCNITAMLGHKPRTKTADQIIAELDALHALGWRGSAFFVDDNFIGNKRQLKNEILPALAAWRKGKKGIQFKTEASINLVDDQELMDLMSQAGFNSLFIGIETPDDAGLNECQKAQNMGRNLLESVKTLQHNGFAVDGGFIVGFDTDDETIFQRQIDFIQQSGIVTAMVGLLQAINGTKLYYRLQEEGRLLSKASGNNVDDNLNFISRMDPQLLHKGYQKILATIYAPAAYYQRVRTFLKEYRKTTSIVVPVTWTDIWAFIRSIVVIGFGKERREYWKLLAWTLTHRPKLFAEAVTFTIYGFHFRHICESVLGSNYAA